MIRVLWLTALYKRPEVTEISFRGLCRIREMYGFDFRAIAVYSGDFSELCDLYDVEGVEYHNKPLGKKWNYGLQHALKYDWDYLMTMGSDDLISKELLENYPWGEEAWGLNRCGVIDCLTGRTAIFDNSYPIGLARCIRRDVIERMGHTVTLKYKECMSGPNICTVPGKVVTISKHFADRIKGSVEVLSEDHSIPKLWGDDLNSGLDYSSDCLLNANGVIQKIHKSDKVLAIDLKSETNIWPFDHYRQENFTINWLSKGEEDAIRRLGQTDHYPDIFGGY